MARTQAADYDRRREAIREAAAGLYARHGFLGASIAQIAAAGATSKSLIYHYYPSKEDILFDVMNSHVQRLVEAAVAIERSESSTEVKIRQLANDLMQRYEGAQSNQKVLLNELSNLPDTRRQEIVDHQRTLLDVVDRLLLQLRPDLAKNRPRRRAIVMMFFGMLNWTHTWFDPHGSISSREIASMAATMFLSGAAKA
jgi:AcrR family transcriptional regulator